MKITILGVFSPYRGGIAHFNTLLFQSLAERNEVSVINFSRQYPNLLFPGKTQMIENESEAAEFHNRMIDSINPISWLKTAREVKRFSPELLIYKYWMPFFAPSLGTIARRVKSNGKTQTLCVIDNLTPHEKRPGDLILNRYLVNATDHFIVMSKTVEADLLSQKPEASYRLVAHPIYCNFGAPIPKDEARKRLGISEKNVILYFGYIRKYKGIQYLIQAVPKFLNRLDALTIIAGEFYEDKMPYIQEIEKTGQSAKIRLIDQFILDEQVNLYFSAADLVVLPYIHATQSGIMQIALGYELPCLVTRVGGLPEMVEEGQTGFIVPPENPDAISEGIIQYFTNADREMIQSNIREKKSLYSWEHFTEQIEEMVSEKR